MKLKKNDQSTLFDMWPAHATMTARTLKQKGFTHNNLRKYRKLNWITYVDPAQEGFFKKSSEDLYWEGLVYGLQKHCKNKFFIGGASALDLVKYGPFVHTPSTLFLFSTSPHHFPFWFRKMKYGVKFERHVQNILPFFEGIIPYNCGEFSLLISCPERAALEITAFTKTMHSFKEVRDIFKTLDALDPVIVQHLLEKCSSIKAKTLLLFFAYHLNLPWLRHLDLTRVELGRGPRTFERYGAYDPNFEIYYPQDLFEEDAESLSNGRTPGRQGETNTFRKSLKNLHWEDLVLRLQHYHKNKFFIGGRSALELVKHGPFVYKPSILFFLIQTATIFPTWFRKMELDTKFELHRQNILPALEGIVPYDCGEFSILISCPERAALEIAAFTKTVHSFKEVRDIFKTLGTLDPHVVQHLLEKCSSFKAKRVLLFFGSHLNLPWFYHLDLTRVELRASYNMLERYGARDSRFKISYPQDLFEEDSKLRERILF